MIYIYIYISAVYIYTRRRGPAAPSFDMPPITIDPSTGKASVEINVKGNEGRVIGNIYRYIYIYIYIYI